jgi:L-alanine-DL-glutamate epimerase-like enolase superfamily enzyme
MQIQLTVRRKTWPLREPFVISRESYTTSEVIVAEIRCGQHTGRGEAAGVDYHGESPDGMVAQVENVRAAIEAGASRAELQNLLPAGGARNALDAALWDLEAKQSGVPVWQRAGVGNKPVTSVCTIGIRSIEEYERRARELASYRWLKIKVAADRALDAVAAVRRGAPNARLVVDPNQAWDLRTLDELAPSLVELHVDVLEQPVPIDAGNELVAGRCPIPICADEALDTAADLPRVRGRYDFVNIKLDKTGGLTAALELAHAARAAGMRLMVGCMTAGSMAMAPGMVVAQLCEVVDLDGPLLQAEDWPDGIVYDNGVMAWPSPRLWG